MDKDLLREKFDLMLEFIAAGRLSGVDDSLLDKLGKQFSSEEIRSSLSKAMQLKPSESEPIEKQENLI